LQQLVDTDVWHNNEGYIELAKVPDFNRKFAKATYL